MRRKIVLFFLAFVLSSTLLAQHKGTPYLLDVFEQGTLFYKDGSIGESLFNYNTVAEKLVFVSSDSTVLEVANPFTTSVAKIGDRIFEHVKNGSYYERVEVADNVFMYIRWHSELLPDGKTGPYGVKNTASSVDNKTSMYTPSGFTGLSVDESYVVDSKNFYYVKVKNKLKNISNVSNFVKLFKDNKEEIEDYIKTENLDWNSFEDMKKAVVYASKYLKQ